MEELTCPFPCTSTTEPSTVSEAQGLTGGPGPQMDGWLSVALEEYKSIRTESLDSMKVQNTILSYGATTIGVILTAGISIIDKNMLLADEAIFLVFIPLIVFFIVMIWAGEVARMYRAGTFLADHEQIISRYVDKMYILKNWDKPALVWENWLRQKSYDNETPHEKLYIQHYSVLSMFLFLAILSIVIGNYKLSGVGNPVYFFLIIDLVEACILIYLTYLALFLLRHFHPSIARWLDRPKAFRRQPWRRVRQRNDVGSDGLSRVSRR
jgi:hypothetical protein